MKNNDQTFCLINLNPATDLSEVWSFDNKVNGPETNDGITAFKEVLIKAAALPKDEGYKLLFATGIVKGATYITGEDRIKALAKSNLADPDLLWSLYKEEGQETLHYLHDTYGVKWMEALRRVLRDTDGRRCSLLLGRLGNGSWSHIADDLRAERSATLPALIIGN